MPAVSAVRAAPDLKLDSAHILLVGLAPDSEDNPTESSFSDLEAAVRQNPCIQDLAAQDRVILIPGSDFVALIFPNDFHLIPGTAAEIYAQCSKRTPLRIGIHSGPVDISDRISGKGLDLARRLLECGDSGHILVSESSGLKLERMGGWIPMLHDYGYCRLPDGERLRMFSMRGNGVGNPCLPRALQPDSIKRAPIRREAPGWTLEARTPALMVLWTAVALGGLFLVGWLVSPTFRSLVRETYQQRPVQVVTRP